MVGYTPDLFGRSAAMATVVNCSPIKVTRVGHLLMIEFETVENAAALERAFADAKLGKDNPAESQRRYAEKLGVESSGMPSMSD